MSIVQSCLSRQKPIIVVISCVCLIVILAQIYRENEKTLQMVEEKTEQMVEENVEKKVDAPYQSLKYNTVGIPKILHQIWSNDVVPNEFVENIRGLVKLNPPPEWQYWFWSLPRGRSLIVKKYPKLLSLFDSSNDLMKADILRVCIIHQYGGAYFDLDTVGVKPLKPFMESRNCSLVNEPPEHVITKDMIVFVDMITNSALLCKSGHLFFNEFIKLVETQELTCKQANQCTGPHLLSHLYFEMKREDNYTILPKLESYQFFQDKYANDATATVQRVCTPGFKYQNTDIWRRQICEEWVRRGKGNRKLSELAYTYHTWYHVGARKVTSDPKNNITSIVPGAILGGHKLT